MKVPQEENGRKQVSHRAKTKNHSVRRSADADTTSSLELIIEEPLEIRVEDAPYAVVMRTPGEELYHAAGFCLAEGIVDTADDVDFIGYDPLWDPNVINVWLTRHRREKIPLVLERKSYVSNTSCGICGKAMTADLYQSTSPTISSYRLNVNDIFFCIDALSEKQKHYQTTRGSHAALIFDEQLEAISFAEDVGRHSALDKAVGKAFLDGALIHARILVLSSRNSHELVQKAARAGLSTIISHSRPTSLAVEMAKALHMTIVFPDKNGDVVIVCGEHRVDLGQSRSISKRSAYYYSRRAG